MSPSAEPNWLRWSSRKVLEWGYGRSVAAVASFFAFAGLGYGAAVAAIAGGEGSPMVFAAAAVSALLALGVAAALLRMVFVVEGARSRLAVAASQDDLTGVYNRRHFLDIAEREWARCRRYEDDVALLLIDVDQLRAIGDAYGPQASNAALVGTAKVASQTLRQADVMARFSGGELIVLLPRTDPLGALDVAERIRERAASNRVVWNNVELASTVSIGVASIGPDHSSLDLVVRDADEALHAARQAGRNCVRAAPIQPRRNGSTYPVISR